MWPFNRNTKKDSSANAVPEEIKKYYQAEKRERTGIAWLLGIGTLLVTMALAVLLFFGGRWVFRTVFDSDKSATETAQTNPSPTPAEAGETAIPDEVNSAATPTPTSTPTPEPVAATSDNLPHTGPEDTLAIFVLVVVGASLFHHLATRRKLDARR